MALVKKPITFGHALVSNSIECLTPHALQSNLVETLDTRGNGSDYVLQKFVKGKGAKPSVYRVMWRSVSSGAGVSGSVTGWYITKIDDEYDCFDGDINDDDEEIKPSGKEVAERRAQRKIEQYSSEDIASNLSAAGKENREIVEQMLNHPDMSASAAVRAFKAFLIDALEQARPLITGASSTYSDYHPIKAPQH